MLDPRSVFLFQTKEQSYLWLGGQCHASFRDVYQSHALATHTRLIEWEGCPENLTVVAQGEEPPGFWKMLKCNSPEQSADFVKINKNWNNWFISLDEDAKIRSARSHKSKMIYAEIDDVQSRPALFIYPYHMEPLYVLDIDDLTEEVFALLCDRAANTCYIWKGAMFNEEEKPNVLNLQEFVHLAIRQFYETEDFSFIQFIFETSDEESENFLKYFS